MALDEKWTAQVHDAALISAMQRVRHYGWPGYGTVPDIYSSWATQDATLLIQETLDEEDIGRQAALRNWPIRSMKQQSSKEVMKDEG
ncbi:MAG: DUF892 family protein [Chloroflexi bacterium]|nr:DUF892 family protein [Chloroflexota bacterium]